MHMETVIGLVTGWILCFWFFDRICLLFCICLCYCSESLMSRGSVQMYARVTGKIPYQNQEFCETYFSRLEVCFFK